MLRIFSCGHDVGEVLSATQPVVQEVIPIYAMGSTEPVGLVRHVLYYLTLPFELVPRRGYEAVDEHGSLTIDRFVLADEDDRFWTYACWSRVGP